MLAQGRDGLGDVAYERHQPEQTLLYQLVEVHYPALVDQLAQQGKSLPDHVHREFEAYLKEVEAGNFETLYDPRLAITSGPGFQPVKQLAGDDG